MPIRLPRFRISHLGFTVGYCTALFAVCNGINLDKLSGWFRAGGAVDSVSLGAYLVAGVCLSIAVFTLVAHRWSVKFFAILLAVASAAATYFIAKYNVAIDSSMVRNTMHTDAVEVGQLLSVGMIPYVVGIVVAVVLISGADIVFRPGYLLVSLLTFVVAVAAAAGALYSRYDAIFRAGNVSNKYIVYQLVPINVISGSVNATTKALRPWLHHKQRDVNVDARVTTPGNLVVVLAVGESSRRKNFSLYGYDRRDTNPELKAVTGLHALDAVATRASTLYALPKILEKNGVKLTTITSRAGVPTACYVNYTLYDNCEAVGETKVSACAHGGKCFDEDVLPLLEKDLAGYQSGYRLVVLHFGGGSHGPAYNERIPPEFRRFTPTCDDADVANACSLEQIYNSYDNTILYVDHVVARALDALEKSRVPYVFFYLSDHGESLMENGVMFHGMPPGMKLPDEQAQIPLLVKSSLPVTLAPRAEYQQPDVFDSVLSLLTVQVAGFDLAGRFVKTVPAPESAKPTG